MIEFTESKFYKALQDFFVKNDKETFLQFLAEFYNRTESIIEKNGVQDDLIKELRDMYIKFNEEGIDENIVREKVNYFVENNEKIQDIITKILKNANNIKNINSQIDIIRNKVIVTFDDFGAKGDIDTDDTEAIKKAIAWAKENNKPIYLMDKRYRVTDTIDVGNVAIRSINGKPGGADPFTLSRPNGLPVFSTPNWNYYFNNDLDLITWENMLKETSYGACIVSDIDKPILYVKNGERFDLDGIGIVGYHRKMKQYGLATEVPTSYKGTSQYLKNINVIGCGSHGIYLPRGLEVTTLDNVVSSYNNGCGLYTGRVNNIDCATEYLNFNNCKFTYNRLHGVQFEYWRKHIKFDNCDLSGNGQYQTNAVDPLLYYDRRVPTNKKDLISGIKCDNGNVETSNGISTNFTVINCYGEMMAKAVHIENTVGSGIINNLLFKSNTFLRVNTLNDNNKGVCYYFNIGYGSNWEIGETYQHALDLFEFEKVPTNGGEIKIYDLDIPQNIIDGGFYKLLKKCDIETTRNILANRIYDNKMVVKDLLGDGTTLTTNAIKNEFTLSTPQLESNYVGVFSITAHWQASNSNEFGGYLLIVTKMPSGVYRMLTIATNRTSGFSEMPTIDDNGILHIPSENYYRYTIQRIDNMKTI